ncbi:MAG: DUF2442 domain-containing protein [Kofleriaceae bacterium]|nr:DUF2442 domain-containing protein [Kofleriaceae bacterium]
MAYFARIDVAIRVWVSERMIFVELSDKRQIGVPADRFRAIRNLSDTDLARAELGRNGQTVEWPSAGAGLNLDSIVQGRFDVAD